MVDRRRHVWVTLARADGDSRPTAGLLVQWHKRHGQWWALVALVGDDGHLVVTWRHASALTPLP